MSNLWTPDVAGVAASLGSFVLSRRDPSFTPWRGRADEPESESEGEAADPLDEARREGFAQGYEEGRLQAELELGPERESLARLAEALSVLQADPPGVLAQLLAEAVERLVRDIVGTSPVEPELLRSRAEAAAALVREEMEPARMRLHPLDLPILDGAGLPLDLVADAELQRGTIVVETAKGWIEDGPAVRLERLRAALDRMGAPR